MIHPSTIFDKSEMNIIKKCLYFSTCEEFIPEWEFSILFGLEISEVKDIANSWPDLDINEDITRRAVSGAVNNMLGYPHGLDSKLENEIVNFRTQLRDISQKLHASSPNNYNV